MYEVVIGEIIAGMVALAALYSLNKLFLTNKLLESERKLRSVIANFKAQYNEVSADRGEIVKGALGDIGIEGIMNELGIDPAILNNPMVKGIIAKYAPRVIEQLSKKTEGGTAGQTTPWM
jgi:hypothetical protein